MTMRRFTLLLLVLACVLSGPGRAAGLVMNVTLDYDQERDHAGTQAVFNEVARHVSSVLGQPVQMIMTQNAERVGERIRTSTYDLLLAPAQLVGTAMRNGYSPVARTKEETSVVLVAGKDSGVTSLETARGKRIALPHRESLVSYMVRGEMNAMGLSPSSYFGQIMYMNRYGAVLYAMEIGQSDLVAMKSQSAQDWVRKHAGAKVVKTLPKVPLAGVAVNSKLDGALKDKVREAFTQMDSALVAKLRRVHFGAFTTAGDADFEFVSTRGFFTPEVLPGVTIATAAQVKNLLAQKVPLFDVRPETHYREAHIPGAVNVTYHMNSPKEVDYDDSVDRFDVNRLPKDKNAPMIFQCNGAECWYSYKAARYMAKRGFTKVYWFRTGLPAWKAAGNAVQSGK
jgi:ABC-type phosphate/phosphonate transport system substrate-binding protein/rhodanese-related sulfurtransferase